MTESKGAKEMNARVEHTARRFVDAYVDSCPLASALARAETCVHGLVICATGVAETCAWLFVMEADQTPTPHN